MAFENLILEIEGLEATDLYEDLVSLEVELEDELASMFRMRLALQQLDEGWSHLDDEKLMVWRKVTISAGFEDETEELISGYITHVKPHFESDIASCSLEIWGMDGSVVMDREEKLRAWPNKKDSDIAAQLLGDNGFEPEVQDTLVIHDENVSTIIQRETDMQFLKRLALRNGFECYVEGTSGFFRAPIVAPSSQPVLAIHFGDETNVKRFSLEVNALTPTNVGMSQIDRSNKEVIETAVNSSQLLPLGSSNATALLPAQVKAGQAFVAMNVVTGNPEMQALCQSFLHQGDWLVMANGEILANEYEHVLKPRQTVTIKGVGETHSGVYYVCHVTHSFTGGGYSQCFRAKRNAIGPTGDEDYSSS